ncbi:hypothetical protein [Pantoea sp. A4]|uniref:hypothetical protein n=1 Tax=Pantoea sp. A4 TaxID=1225184 RepID=UPI00036E20B2|nr:hypothetical protein [Pantoea sp. A4]
MKKIILAPLILLFSVPCFADLKETSPKQVCSFLSDLDLKGRAWTDYGDGTAGCASNYKDIGTGSPLANNLAFYANGSDSTVNNVKLVLNFNQPKSRDLPIRELKKASEKLSLEALGAKLPDSIKKAISLGQPLTAKVGTGTIDITRDDWPSGKGYEIKVIMK